MNENQFRYLLDKYLQERCTTEEEKLLHEFYDSFQMDNQGAGLDVPDMWLSEAKISRHIGHHITLDERKRYEEQRRKAARNRLLLKAVASVLLVVSLGIGSYIAYRDMPVLEVAWIEKATLKGQKASITLTDGTRVYLNVDSKLSFPEHFAADKREVVLEGEAFFEVTRNPRRPFVIKSGDLTTMVLGTSFNVKAFEGEPQQVTVVTGKVKVKADAREGNGKPDEVLLAPYQQAFYDGQLSKKDTDVEQYIAWREKVLQFDEVSLEDAAVILERWFDVSIDIKNAKTRHCKISGKYINESLINIMESFKHILGVKYQVAGDRDIIISGEGCHI